MFYPVFSLYTSVTSCKKSEKFNASIFYKSQKTPFGPLFVQKPQGKYSKQKNFKTKFIPKKTYSILSLYAFINLRKKCKLHALAFENT